MKSKTFCFNWTIFKKNVTHYWPIWSLYLAYLLVTMPVVVWQLTTMEYYSMDYDKAFRMYDIMQSVISVELMPFPTFAAAAVVALAMFSYLYSAKSANMIHALPVNRLELYVTNYLSGLTFLIIPELISFFVTVIVCLTNDITCIQYLFYATLAQMGTAFFAYSLAVFVAMFTGQAFAMPFYFVLVNYLYVGCMYLVSEIINLFCYGVEDAWNPGRSCVLSPLYYLGNNLRSSTIYESATASTVGIRIFGVKLVGAYAAVAVVLIVVAYQLYKRRQIETAGDWVSIGIVKPVFRWGAALCGGILLSIMVTALIQSSCGASAYPCMVVSIVVMGFVCFFAAEMLLEKNFRVFKKRRLIEWAGFAVVAVCFVTVFELDVFGIEKRLPAADEVEAAFVYMDYPIEVGEEDIETLLALHRQVIDNKRAYMQNERDDGQYYYTTFRYYLKDGTRFERRYALPITGQYIADETTPSGWILSLEKQPENMKRSMFGIGYGENTYITASIERYDEQGNMFEYTLEEEEKKAVLDAFMRDIEEGNFEHTLYSLYQNGQTQYYNSISVNYYNPAGYNDMYEYFAGYRSYAKDDNNARTRGVNNNVYLSFYPECTHLIETLNQLGIINDTWKLYTSDEYEAMVSQSFEVYND